jgi:predicted permease
METLWLDIKYGIRMLGKKPGFTAIAVLTLALGIGANTTIFSILNAVLLRPLPFPEPQRLVTVWGTDVRNGELHRTLSYPDFVDFRNQNHSLEGAAAYDDGTFTLTGRGEPAQLHGGIVSASLLSVLRATPELGNGFSPADDQPGARVVLLSHALWKAKYGGEPGIVGQTITLNERPYTVVGVMPATFQFPLNTEPIDLWTTMAVQMVSTDGGSPITSERGAHFLVAIGRLKAGTSVEQGNADAAAVAAGLEKQYPDDDGHLGLALQPAADALVGDVRQSLLLLFGAVGFVLLIACANVANLLLARGASREREIAVRAALGAGGLRMVRQLLTESVILSMTGGIAGLLIAVSATNYLSTLPALQIPRIAQARLDWMALSFMTAVSVLTGIIFGLAPALRSMKVDLSSTLKAGGRADTGNTSQTKMRRMLVVGEVSLALVLLIGATLMGESLMNLWRVPPGFDAHGVLAFDVNLPSTRYGKPEQSAAFYRELLERVRATPGVKNASGIFPLPLSDSQVRTTFVIEGRPVPKNEEPRTQFRSVGLNYFSTMKIPLLAGREFTARDDMKSTPVVIINKALADKFFPGENAIGKRIRPEAAPLGEPPMREIVGIVGNVKHRSLAEQPDPESYMPYEQEPIGDMTMVVRVAGNPLDLVAAMRQQVNGIDPQVPLYRARTLESYVSDSMAQKRFTGLLYGTFAGLGLLLAVVGLYGVMSHLVAQRTHEIGVRLAVGAARADILRMVLQHGLWLSSVGMAIGTLGALALSKVLASQLFGVTATDGWTYAAVIVTLGLVAAAACYFPAMRATRVDPIVALRYE